MRIHVDWLTFTCVKNTYTGIDGEVYGTTIEDALLMQLGEAFVRKAMNGVWVRQERARAPYRDAWTLENSSILVMASPKLNHLCVEVSGEGCERIIALDMMRELLELTKERVTRVDIACDIETETKPQDFVKERTHVRMQAGGEQHSRSGETVYVGSKSSERYVRCYRYNEPHPRSHLLRVEHVFRRDYAKKTVLALCELGESATAKACGNAFGWSHADWKVSSENEADISIVSPERKMGKTVFWMVNTVGSSFKKLVREGVIRDPKAFLEAYFLEDGEVLE